MNLGIFQISEQNVVAAHVVIIDRFLEERGWSFQQELFCLQRFSQFVQAKSSVQEPRATVGRDATELAANGEGARPLFFAHEMMETQLQDLRARLECIIERV